MRVLLLGEAPNEAGRSRAWLLPDRLGDLGWSIMDYLRVFQVRDNFIVRQGHARAPLLIHKHGLLAPDRRDKVDRVVILGRRVARCFEWEGFHTGAPLAHARVPLLEWHVIRADRVGDYLTAAILPHPSGIWWHMPENREAARAFLDKLRQEVCDADSRNRLGRGTRQADARARYHYYEAQESGWDRS